MLNIKKFKKVVVYVISFIFQVVTSSPFKCIFINIMFFFLLWIIHVLCCNTICLMIYNIFLQ